MPGIEITAVHDHRDVHMLGYFLDPANAELATFLDRQRDDRRRRLFEMADALDRAGAPIDRQQLHERAAGGRGRAVGRPLLADALVRAGHVASIAEAFDRFLGEGRAAFVPRQGASPVDVIALIARAGGLASLAHPGKLRGGDDLLPALVDAGLPAIEVYHPDHDEVHVGWFSQRARTYGLLVTGGIRLPRSGQRADGRPRPRRAAAGGLSPAGRAGGRGGASRVTAPDPVIEIAALTKHYQAGAPLRIETFVLAGADRVVLAGFDRLAAEMFVHLVTGAAVPDEGDVRIGGRNTRDFSTDTEWLASLDRFGLVSERAVLLDGLPTAANLALPITVAIDPLAPEVRAQVEALAAEVGLRRDRLDVRTSDLAPDERIRVHLGRALASSPDALLLEHPTSTLPPALAHGLASTLRRVSEARRIAWVALSDDANFARASGATRLTLKPETGELLEESGLWRRILTGRWIG